MQNNSESHLRIFTDNRGLTWDNSEMPAAYDDKYF